MIRIRRLGPAFIHHVEAYGQLGVAALHELGARGRTRAMLLAAGVVLGIAFVTLVGATLIAAGWGSPYRYWIAAGVLAGFGVGAAGSLAGAFARLPPSTHVQALRDEWQKDKAWLSSSDREAVAPAGGVGTPVRLQAAGRDRDPGRASAASLDRSAERA